LCNIIGIIKLRIIWKRKIPCIRAEKFIKKCCSDVLKEGDHVGDLDINGRVFLEKFGVMLQTGFTYYSIESIGRIL